MQCRAFSSFILLPQPAAVMIIYSAYFIPRLLHCTVCRLDGCWLAGQRAIQRRGRMGIENEDETAAAAPSTSQPSAQAESSSSSHYDGLFLFGDNLVFRNKFRLQACCFLPPSLLPPHHHLISSRLGCLSVWDSFAAVFHHPQPQLPAEAQQQQHH